MKSLTVPPPSILFNLEIGGDGTARSHLGMLSLRVLMARAVWRFVKDLCEYWAMGSGQSVEEEKGEPQVTVLSHAHSDLGGDGENV